MNDNTTIVLIYLLSILSALGSSYIIYMYIKNRGSTAQKLICYLSIGDLVFSIANIIYVNPSNNMNAAQCSIQAFLRYASLISSLFSAFFISLCMYLSVIKLKEISNKYTRNMKICVFVLPLILAIIPLLTNDYGMDQFACGFKQDEEMNETGSELFQGLVLFYIPIWITTILNFILVMKVFKYFHEIESDNENDILKRRLSSAALKEKSDIKLSKLVVLSTLAYPIIQSLCWAPYTAHRIITMFGTGSETLRTLKFLAADSQGFFNAIAFALIAQWFKKERISRLTSVTLTVSNEDEYNSSRSSLNSVIISGTSLNEL